MCNAGNTQGVIEAIKAGANVNAKDNNGVTALMMATAEGQVGIVNALISAGTDVRHRDNDGKTALDYARENDKFRGTDVLKRLEELSR